MAWTSTTRGGGSLRRTLSGIASDWARQDRKRPDSATAASLVMSCVTRPLPAASASTPYGRLRPGPHTDEGPG